jgi:hypothetical protein
MTGLVAFMSSPAGRIARVVAGIVLIVVGAVIGGAGWFLAVVGLVPLAAGVFDVCLLGPVFVQPLRGVQARGHVASQR